MSQQYSVTDLVISPRAVGTGSPAGSALENVDTNSIANGCSVFVETGAAKGFWYLERSSTATSDGVTVIAPISGPGRWLRSSVGGLPPAPPSARYKISSQQTQPGSLNYMVFLDSQHIEIGGFDLALGPNGNLTDILLPEIGLYSVDFAADCQNQALVGPPNVDVLGFLELCNAAGVLLENLYGTAYSTFGGITPTDHFQMVITNLFITTEVNQRLRLQMTSGPTIMNGALRLKYEGSAPPAL